MCDIWNWCCVFAKMTLHTFKHDLLYCIGVFRTSWESRHWLLWCVFSCLVARLSVAKSNWCCYITVVLPNLINKWKNTLIVDVFSDKLSKVRADQGIEILCKYETLRSVCWSTYWLLWYQNICLGRQGWLVAWTVVVSQSTLLSPLHHVDVSWYLYPLAAADEMWLCCRFCSPPARFLLWPSISVPTATLTCTMVNMVSTIQSSTRMSSLVFHHHDQQE